MKWYTCHKRVQAAEIIGITRIGDGIRLALDEGPPVEFADGSPILARGLPVVGDFLVQYEDGYQSFSPRKAFIDGYTVEGQTFAEIKKGLK